MGFDWKAIAEINALKEQGRVKEAQVAELKMQAGYFAPTVVQKVKRAIRGYSPDSMSDFDTTVTLPNKVGDNVAYTQVSGWLDRAKEMGITSQDSAWMLGNPLGKELGRDVLVAKYEQEYGKTGNAMNRIPASPVVTDVKKTRDEITMTVTVPVELARVAASQTKLR